MALVCGRPCAGFVSVEPVAETDHAAPAALAGAVPLVVVQGWCARRRCRLHGRLPNGLPFGLEVTGPRFRDHLLLDLAGGPSLARSADGYESFEAALA